MRTMADMWEEFRLSVIPDLPSTSAQYKDLKKTFYGGAIALFDWIMNDLDLEEEPTEGDADRIDLMGKELKNFGLLVIAGLE